MSIKKSEHKSKIKTYEEKSDSVILKGGHKLKGTVSAQGSKNAILPILSSLPLIPEAEIYNIPEISDVYEMIDILESIGSDVSFNQGVLKINNKNVKSVPIGSDFTSKMRASSLFLGPMLAKFKKSSVGMPGGCVIGSRPLDIHIDGFETLGAKSLLEDGLITLKAKRLEGEYALPFPSVGATQNLITGSVLSPSDVTLHNVAIEPEVLELIRFLNKSGAKIRVFDSKTIKIKGVKKLKKVHFNVQSDRIEAFTLITAALATKGRIKVVNCDPSHLTAPLQILAKMGADIRVGKDVIEARYVKPLQGVKINTGVYPGFPTDCQQQISVLMLTAESPSYISENVFDNRFKHLDELRKMGADTNIIEGKTAIINPSSLKSCKVDSYDLRGAASMIIAGLITKGVTSVDGLRYLHRGYENYVDKLNFLGADIIFKTF